MPSPQVLLIEDDPEDLRMILETLGDYCPDSRIMVAQDGGDAISVLQGAAVRRVGLRLIVLDLDLPESG